MGIRAGQQVNVDMSGWSDATDRFAAGTVVAGRVASVRDDGVTVQLAEALNHRLLFTVDEDRITTLG